jgi:hypothetical protein
MIIPKVISSIVMDSTAMGPQALLSRKSNIVTEIVFVRAVNSRIVADSSRMLPMKMRIHVAMTPLRDEQAEVHRSPAHDLRRVVGAEHPRRSVGGCELDAHRKLFRQIGKEDDGQRP